MYSSRGDQEKWFVRQLEIAAELQRVDVGDLVAAETVGIDQLQHPDLLALMRQAGAGHARNAVAAQTSGEMAELGLDSGV